MAREGPGFQNLSCPGQSGLFPESYQPFDPSEVPHGVLELEVKFNLSDGDAANITGSAVLSDATVPEAGSLMLLTSGLAAIAMIVRRRELTSAA